MNVRLKGVPGGGKTTLPTAAFGADLITVQGHHDLTISVSGRPIPAGP